MQLYPEVVTNPISTLGLFVFFLPVLDLHHGCVGSPLAVGSGGWASNCGGSSCRGVRALGAWVPGSRVRAQQPWCTSLAACGIFPDQELKLCLLHSQADSSPLTEPPGKTPVSILNSPLKR